MDSIDALVGGRPEVQAYLNHRFQDSVKAGVAEATRRVHTGLYDDTADCAEDATSWGLAQCACTQCDLALYRAAAAAACEEATARLSGTREAHRAARHELDADDRAEVLCRAAEVVVDLFDSRVWSEPAAACAGAESESAALTTAQLDALSTSGVVVVPRWLPTWTTSELPGEMRGLSTSGYMQPTPQKRVGVRDDAVGFLSGAEAEAHAGAATAAVVRLLRGLGDVLQRITDAAVRVPTRVMATHYPGGGARYVPHVDNDGADDHTAHRRWSCIVYCNADWGPAHGGQLRCHVGGGGGGGDDDDGGGGVCDGGGGEGRAAAEGVNDADGSEGRTEGAQGGGEYGETAGAPVCECTLLEVPPEAGTLVVFDSRRVLHEVLPAYASRCALTLWLETL